MGYWEDRYIDYLAEQDGQIGGAGWRNDFNPRASLERHLNMAEMWKPLSVENYLGWINAIIDEAGDELSDWENSFIESLQNRLSSGNNLTERQAEILERIYNAKTS